MPYSAQANYSAFLNVQPDQLLLYSFCYAYIFFVLVAVHAGNFCKR